MSENQVDQQAIIKTRIKVTCFYSSFALILFYIPQKRLHDECAIHAGYSLLHILLMLVVVQVAKIIKMTFLYGFGMEANFRKFKHFLYLLIGDLCLSFFYTSIIIPNCKLVENAMYTVYLMLPFILDISIFPTYVLWILPKKLCGRLRNNNVEEFRN